MAVEVHQPRGYGRVRMGILTDASAACLHPFVTANIEPGAVVITDGWMGYSGIERPGYTRDRRSQRAARARGEDPGKLLPGVHRVASLAKRWQLGTDQGSVEPAHLQSYLDEFASRFNRRGSRSRGMVFHRVLELAVGHKPVRYRDLVVDPKPKKIKPVPPGGGGNPPSLDRPRAARLSARLQPGLGTFSSSSSRTMSAPAGTNAAITGRLSDLRRVIHGGFSLRCLSPHCRRPASATARSRPLVVSRYS